MKKVESIWAELSAKAQEASQEVAQESTELSAEEVKLAGVQDAEAIYKRLVKDTQAQASILMKVEAELKSLAQDAKELANIEQRLEAMAKELGVDPDSYHYEAATWTSNLNKYANEVGVISNKL